VNHFNNNACLTSKYGICKSLRSIMFSEAVEVDRFFPKAYDMSDLQDFENFLEVYKWTYCESIIKKALLVDAEPSPEELMRLKIACLVTSRRLLRGDKLLVNITNSRYNLCTFNEWRFLTAPKECNMDEIIEDFKLWEMEEWGWGETRREAHCLLQKLGEREPQSGLNGCGNIWIVKPACNSLFMQFFPEGEASSVCPTLMIFSTTHSARKRSTSSRNTSKTRLL
jgi:tubulin monoglycylase TTLL3/8